MIDAALAWADRGVPVFPLRPRDKIPLTAHGVKDASCDPEQIREWWTKWPDANIGGATGAPAGRWVLDLDGDAGRANWTALEAVHGPAPESLAVTTARGRHLWFTLPDAIEVRNSASKVAPGIDVRGTGGYVVLPPSVHPSGLVYELENDCEATPAPSWLLDLVLRPAVTPPATPPTPLPLRPPDPSLDRKRVIGMAEAAAARIASAPPGTRNDTVNREAFSVGGFAAEAGVAIDEIAPILEAAAVQAEQPPAMVRAGLQAGAQKPRPLPPREQDWLEASLSGPGGPTATEATTQPDAPDLRRLASLDHTDLGNAERFNIRFGENARWCDPRTSWLTWNERHWEWDERRQVHTWAQQTVRLIAKEPPFLEAELAKMPAEIEDGTANPRHKALTARVKSAHAHAKSSQASARISAISTESRALRGRAVSLDDLDRDPWILVAENATLDLQTGRAREHRRNDLVTRALQVRYDPVATCPVFDRFLLQALPKPDVRAFMLRWIGYTLTGVVSEQRWSLWHGEGSNGKSTLIELLGWLMGRYSTALPAGFLEYRLVEPHSSETMGLQGARFASGVEPKGRSQWDSEKIKALTGGDRIRAHLMRQDYVEFRPTHKLVVSANRLPRTDDQGFGFWRRIIVVPFDVQFKGSAIDPQLPTKLQAEGSGILNRALEGLADYRRNGLQVPDVCTIAASAYRLDQDTVGRFIAERCVVESSAKDKSGNLYRAYRAWFTEQGLPDAPVTAQAFGRALGNVPGCASYDGAKKVRMWTGIRLVETEMHVDQEDWTSGRDN